MDVVETLKENKQYNKCKFIVKTWEKEFKSKYSRTPSKFDIKEAPLKIKYAYKKYFQLKSEALENSLSVCDFDEDIAGSPEPVQYLDPASVSPPTKQISLNLPSGQELEKMLSEIQTKETPPEKEIDHCKLSGNVTVATISKPSNPFTDLLSKKLFQNKSFSVRNPRKSLSRSQSVVTTGKSISDGSDNKLVKATSEDTVDICLPCEVNDKVVPNKVNTLVGNSISNSITMAPKLLRQYDKEWLKRATGTCTELSTSTATENSKFGLSNITVDALQDKQDFVENSESESEEIPLYKLKPALKKRKIESSSVSSQIINQKKSMSEESKLESDEKLKARKNKRNNGHKLKKNVENSDGQQPPDITEYVMYKIENDIEPRHNNVSDMLQTSSQNTKIERNEISRIEKKISDGTLNENFVKIDIKKKVFVRGKKNISYSKYKKQLWKDKKALHAGMEFPESGKITCFKCGQDGHMARYCIAHKGDSLLPLDNCDNSDTPTLEDMQSIVNKETTSRPLIEQLSQSIYEPSPIPDDVIKLLDARNSENDIKPVYNNDSVESTKELNEALAMFGHQTFRSGQKEAITRILCGKSTLLILPTGSGKSLCYQLPAYIYSKHYKCITLVISPLVSLMEDQVINMPGFLKAGCLHTNQPPTQRQKIIKYLKDGLINILLISPEALISGDSASGISGLFKSLPQIAFACIDEVHCVSQWSHNFRPSYLMICRVLREKLNVKCILGLTATASKTTIKSVVNHIHISDGLNGVVKNPTLPDNLHLSVSLEKDKDQALITFLTLEKIKSFSSIIVYCIRRDECERVASLLRSFLQEVGKVSMEKQKNKRKRMSYIAEAYHAGMSGAQRKKIQKHFMDGSLRIIVATVAFGMGINKSDIRCIIHYNMPSSFESYVQEVGRAGRDGLPAYCHVFISNNSTDKNELLKHIHANTIDRPVIRKLLQKLFIPCTCKVEDNIATNGTDRCKGHEVGIPIDCTVEELDLPPENIATLLCYVELHPKQYIKVLNNAYTQCKIISYGGPRNILDAANNCPPLAMAYLLESKKNTDIIKKNILEFPVIDVASAIGWESGMTKYHLKNLEWVSDGGISRRSQLKVEFNTLGFRIRSPGDLSPAELDEILDDIHKIVIAQEKNSLLQLEESCVAFKKVCFSKSDFDYFDNEIHMRKSQELKTLIGDYFEKDDISSSDITLEERPLDTEHVKADIRALISTYKDCNFTGRSIARILQGIPSPNYPAIIWGRTKFWRSHLHEDFYGIAKLATQQIIEMRM